MRSVKNVFFVTTERGREQAGTVPPIAPTRIEGRAVSVFSRGRESAPAASSRILLRKSPRQEHPIARDKRLFEVHRGFRCSALIGACAPLDCHSEGGARGISAGAGSPAPTEESTHPRLFPAHLRGLSRSDSEDADRGQEWRGRVPAGLGPPERASGFLGWRTRIQHAPASRGAFLGMTVSVIAATKSTKSPF
jgi:hypothetical protein